MYNNSLLHIDESHAVALLSLDELSWGRSPDRVSAERRCICCLLLSA